jgi:hypothetical protein
VVNKLLIALGAAVLLAAFAGLGGRQVGALTAQAAEKAPESVSWRGGFVCEGAYEPGDIVYHEGSSYLATEKFEGCVTPPKPPWELVAAGGERGAVGLAGQKGATGPAGTFGGLRSADGSYEVIVDNSGIKLVAPDASVEMTPTEVKVRGDQNVVIDGAATTEVRASATLSIDGGIVTLGGSSCRGVARKDLSVVQGFFNTVMWPGGPGSVPMADGPLLGGIILNGSGKVQAC